MREVIFRVRLFQSEAMRRPSEAVLRLFLESLTAANVAYLKLHPDTPGVYAANVVYKREKPHVKGAPIPEEWLQIPYVIERGWGDCEDLACWRTAELLMKGIKAQPAFTWRKLGNYSVYHIFVRLPDGTTEDPSRKLGMEAIA